MKKFNAVIFCIAIICLIAVTIIILTDEKPVYTKVSHTVEKGECIWEIADTYAPKTDKFKYINMIKTENSLEDSTIYPGQTLTVFTEEK